MATPSRQRMLRAREIEHERIQSEIRRNDAEAKKMEAEARHFVRYSYVKHITAVVVSAFLLWSFTLDTFKTIYDITLYKIKESNESQKIISHENEKLKKERLGLEKQNKQLKNERIELEKQKHNLEISIQRLRQLESYR